MWFSESPWWTSKKYKHIEQRDFLNPPWWAYDRCDFHSPSWCPHWWKTLIQMTYCVLLNENLGQCDILVLHCENINIMSFCVGHDESTGQFNFLIIPLRKHRSIRFHAFCGPVPLNNMFLTWSDDVRAALNAMHVPCHRGISSLWCLEEDLEHVPLLLSRRHSMATRCHGRILLAGFILGKRDFLDWQVAHFWFKRVLMSYHLEASREKIAMLGRDMWLFPKAHIEHMLIIDSDRCKLSGFSNSLNVYCYDISTVILAILNILFGT